jgi:pheromone shutdown protein TraB
VEVRKMGEDKKMQIHVGTEITVAVSVKRDRDYRVYLVDYDTETNTLRRITYIGNGRRVEVGAVILEEMIEIVKSMGLKFP